jgi:hypothetical protein
MGSTGSISVEGYCEGSISEWQECFRIDLSRISFPHFRQETRKMESSEGEDAQEITENPNEKITFK